MTLLQIAGLLTGKYAPHDMKGDENAVRYLHRRLSATSELQRQLTAYEATVTNLEAQVQGLAAENGNIKVMNDCLSEELRGYESDGAFDGPKMHLLWWKVETPHTDAALAEIRAQGVDAFAADLGNAYQQLRAGSPQAKALKAVV
ncbi:hypothetical protein, partial [Cedecea sp. VD21]